MCYVASVCQLVQEFVWVESNANCEKAYDQQYNCNSFKGCSTQPLDVHAAMLSEIERAQVSSSFFLSVLINIF